MQDQLVRRLCKMGTIFIKKIGFGLELNKCIVSNTEKT